jgi:hypothetical protein
VIIDITAAVVALDAASYSGPTATVDALADPVDPALDGSHLAALLYGERLDMTLAQVLLTCTETTVEDGWLRRGIILVGVHGRAGIAVGHGYVVEPADTAYCLTPPELTRWAAAYIPPGLTMTVQP